MLVMKDKAVLQKELNDLQEEYAKTKDNKATNRYVGLLRSKMARLRKALAEKKRNTGAIFAVRKSGDATVVLVGFPSVGKSSLINRLTNAESKVRGYAFTTLGVIPGMMEYRGARIQILDMPGLIEGAHIGKGAGTQVASVIRVADLLLFIVDATAPGQIDRLLEELSLLDVKVNKEKPVVRIERKESGGISVEANGHKVPSLEEVRAVMRKIGAYNGKVIFHSNASVDELIELLVDSAVYVKGIAALNKTDLITAQEAEQMRLELEPRIKMPVVPISATRGTNLEALRTRIFENLDIMRIYLKPKDGEADMSKPFVLRRGQTIMDLAKGLHSKIAKELRYAYVTGRSAKFRAQKVGAEHVLLDGDVVTLVYEKFAA